MCCCAKIVISEIYSKIAYNAVLETRPSIVHFSGFEIGKKHTQVLVGSWLSMFLYNHFPTLLFL